ncbi:MAG: lytic transglycosylase domain-containing protein [Desulfuromonadales bacterium]|nr:lytic transglycosylase domain-containing protein [Desulfuromonadales bacterium]MBN2793243.1 lytic transglycosylase domain-containing protein [Desulfuromonadales bacterium]
MKTILTLICLALLVPTALFAAEENQFYSDDDLREIYCFERAGQEYGVSPLLLWAIAKTESNFNPRAINKNSETSIDIGLMQINSYWGEKFGEDFWTAQADPCFNIRSGAFVLATCFEQYGKNWAGIGCYNADTTSKQLKYVTTVFNQIKDELKRRQQVVSLEKVAREISGSQVAEINLLEEKPLLEASVTEEETRNSYRATEGAVE